MKPNHKQRFFFRAILLLACHYLPTAAALESDADQPIAIDSNTATYDEASKTSTYTGNVISVQGSIRVNSDKLVAYQKNGEIDKLVFTGNPAKFKQTPSAGGEDILGNAMIGEYYPKKNLLVLQNQAVVVNGNATYASNLIEYDIKSSLVKAGEKSSDTKRVHVILKPKPKDKPESDKPETETNPPPTDKP
ncbi:lipopolysaccharide transport periplasmic protein LptA [Methylovulum psychrotolerans]|jgi:lipopolysaccharide export system protein LptA|uniref:Lipopolysaccharide export system protein LptA n=1 Tax=Methylovulum psychrotolerans TaxID=1704499 RepID=A0A1Z4C0N0_9GAMM|nr:lipopolysaccharide transport periplasmic protein LptA [Methylovulum psychrotolerans]ASF47073.1 lipopolysaccharide transport periplasmic protein LptA [Methylovulum psychrotolerans]MBT9098634.1 lipopolysaccharide transport periplasmic protein LptA [Methylovulum psychrotolerans]